MRKNETYWKIRIFGFHDERDRPQTPTHVNLLFTIAHKPLPPLQLLVINTKSFRPSFLYRLHALPHILNIRLERFERLGQLVLCATQLVRTGAIASGERGSNPRVGCGERAGVA